jgi:zinc protease
MLEFQLPENFSTKQAEELKALTVNDINALAKKYLPYNNMAIVVVGDAKKNREALEKLGYEVVNMKL